MYRLSNKRKLKKKLCILPLPEEPQKGRNTCSNRILIKILCVKFLLGDLLFLYINFLYVGYVYFSLHI